MRTLSRIGTALVTGLLLYATGSTQHAWADQAAGAAAPTAKKDAKALFEEGDRALREGDLGKAEQAFKGVVAIDPQNYGAYANLGVVYMRRQQWDPALEALHKAEPVPNRLLKRPPRSH